MVLEEKLRLGRTRGFIKNRETGPISFIQPKAAAVAAFSNTLSTNFDGGDDFVDIGNVAALDFAHDDTFSISAWVKPIDLLDSYIFSKQTSVGFGPSGYHMRMMGGGAFAGYVADGTDYIVRRDVSAVISTGVWQHLVVTYDGGGVATGITIYYENSSLSGETLQSNPITSGVSNTSSALIGTLGNLNEFNGNIDEVSVWDKELSSGEVSEIYNSGTPDNLSNHSAVANLVGWWRMGDGDTFPTVTDNSSNSNDGTMTNMSAGDFESDTP